MENQNTLKTILQDVRQLMGVLDQKPNDISTVRALARQLEQVVCDVDQLKQKLRSLG